MNHMSNALIMSIKKWKLTFTYELKESFKKGLDVDWNW